MNIVGRAARHVGTTAGPVDQALQGQVYRDRDDRSTANRLEELGAVLLSTLRSRGPEQEFSLRCLKRTLNRHVRLRAGEVAA